MRGNLSKDGAVEDRQMNGTYLICVCHRDGSTSAAHNLICMCRRDGSASATYYFDDQMAAKTDNKSWLYLKMLKQEEEERVRKEQVRFRERRGAVVLKACVC